ncbi:MAG TPA: hypothetical protein VMI35_14110 [Puia sp.]|nr:hypothetical protein [Puia sp.]
MKKVFLLYGMFLMLACAGMAQDGSKLEALKIGYLTRKLNLSPEEAQRFWPIYNQYSEEIRQARQSAIQNGKTEIELEDNILTIRKKYNGEFVRALSPEKANTFFHAEKEFGNFVQREMQRRQLRMMQQPRRPMIK